MSAPDSSPIDFELYEQAPELTEVGAGIGLFRGALQLLDWLGLGDEARSRGSWIRHIYLADKGLSIRRELPANYNGLCIHRAALIDILRSRLPEERIHLSKRVTDVSTYPDRSRVEFADGSAITSACTVAADGIHSVARRKLFPDVPIRYIDQTIWRGITKIDVPEMLRDSYVEVWDERMRFLTVPMSNEETFWLAVKAAPPGGKDDPATVKEELLQTFRNFHPTLRDLIRYSGDILRDDLADLGNPGGRPWHRHRIAFIGDAIHATTPNLAQGGCQAMEDAVCLAQCLSRPSFDDGAAGAFSKRRRLSGDGVGSGLWSCRGRERTSS